MSNQIRPSSELFMNKSANHTALIPGTAPPQHGNTTYSSISPDTPSSQSQATQTTSTNNSPTTQNTTHLNPQAHPTVLKPRHRLPRLSRIPLKSVKEDHDIETATVQPQSTASHSMLGTILQSEQQAISTTQRINDLYNFASFIMPPYLAKQLAELKVMDEDAWMTKFPKDIGVDSKLGAVQSLLIELGLVIARLSEKVKKKQEPNDVD